MPFFSMLHDIAAPYSALESLGYDAFVAPAVAAFEAPLIAEFIHEVRPGAQVLDVGCGGGHLALKVAAARGDLRVTGVDLSVQQVGRAQRRGASFGERVRFLVGSAMDLPLPADAFDVVLSVASVKHWPDALQGMREMLRVLKPGGLFMLAEADRGCRLEDVRAFAAGTRLPPVLQKTFVPFFRAWVAGPSPDLLDARAWLDTLGLDDAHAERIAGAPALWLRGRKPLKLRRVRRPK